MTPCSPFHTQHPDTSRVTYIKVVDHTFGEISGDVSVSYHKTMLGERYGATVTLTSKVLLPIKATVKIFGKGVPDNV